MLDRLPIVACLALLVPSSARAAGGADASRLIEAARVLEEGLTKAPAKLKLRHHSEELIRRWQQAERSAAGQEKIVAIEGELRAWKRLAHWSGRESDRARAHALDADIGRERAVLARAARDRSRAEARNRASAAQDRGAANATPAERASAVTGGSPLAPDHWLTRVSVEVEGESFIAGLDVEHALAAERHVIPPRAERGGRVYFDVSPLVAATSVLGDMTVEHAGIARIRVGQFDGDTVRIVFDASPGQAAPEHIEFVPEPPRFAVGSATRPEAPGELKEPSLSAIVEEIRSGIAESEASPGAASHPSPSDTQPKGEDSAKDHGVPQPAPDPSRASVTKEVDSRFRIRRIVVDPGHGGKDTGAPSSAGAKEKDVNLAIAKKLGEELARQLGVEIVYTRTTDEFVSLRRRVEIANDANADLFVSVHANAHRSRRVHGIETYYLNTTSNQYAQRLALRENAEQYREEEAEVPEPDRGMPDDDTGELPSGPVGLDLKLLLADLAMKSATDASRRLASYVQSSTVGLLARSHADIADLGVKHALFYVLLGARMPSVLVEAGFMTHPEESRRLSDARYQQRVATAIANGIGRFAKDREEIASRF